MSDLKIELAEHVATVRLCRPPANHFDLALLTELADGCAALDDDPGCRVIVLCSQGKHFCAGADFSGGADASDGAAARFYAQAVRLMSGRTPMVAAVQGAAIGGGLGLALAADFRVGTPDTRLSANFAALGLHHGFGLSVTLPAVVGQQKAWELLLTGRRIGGREAHQIGLLDELTDEDPGVAATRFAARIAAAAPLAVTGIRATLRADLVARLPAAVEREGREQNRLRSTEDFAEGVAAAAARRTPEFRGR